MTVVIIVVMMIDMFGQHEYATTVADSVFPQGVDNANNHDIFGKTIILRVVYAYKCIEM
jgi:glycine/serine hydroxymethyltransferase